MLLDEYTGLFLSTFIAGPTLGVMVFLILISFTLITLTLPIVLVFEKFDPKQYHMVELNPNLQDDTSKFIPLKENETSLFTYRYASAHSKSACEKWLKNNGYHVRRIRTPSLNGAFSAHKYFFTKGSPGSRKESVLIIYIGSCIRSTNSTDLFSAFPFQFKEDGYNYPFDLSKFTEPKYPAGWVKEKTDVAFEPGWYSTDKQNTTFNDYYGIPINLHWFPDRASHKEREESCYGFLDL